MEGVFLLGAASSPAEPSLQFSFCRLPASQEGICGSPSSVPGLTSAPVQ